MEHDYRTSKRNRLFFISALACGLGAISMPIAKVLLLSIAWVNNLSYFHRFSFNDIAPGENHLGWLAILVPVIGGLIVGVMAKYGSAAIRGHGIPEAMESILLKDSKTPTRVMFLKPISAAFAIGTGGPFGAEGPIIATGGAVGSWLGQVISVTHYERKILLASGAAAGMTAIFGTPFSGVLLAIELLLFEFRPKSFIPVALAAATAGTLRFMFIGQTPFIQMTDVHAPGMTSLPVYLAMGAVFGFISVLVTRSVYWIEDTFEKLPVHWAWWPAIGGIAVGVIGLIQPQTLGVGYSNITNSLNGQFALSFVASLVLWKFISWSIALGSGTSGGTLAPLLTLGSGLGLIIGTGFEHFFPRLAVDPHMAALVGMASLFAGCSHALLASVVFAFEITKQPIGLVPLLGSCSIAYLIATTSMPTSIMTEKIVRRGVRVPNEYFPRSELEKVTESVTANSPTSPH